MDTITAINALSIGRQNAQNMLDALNLAVSILDGTYKSQLTELDAANASNAQLTQQLSDANASIASLQAAAPIDANPAPPIGI